MTDGNASCCKHFDRTVESVRFDPRHARGKQIDGQLEMRKAVPHLPRRLPRQIHRRQCECLRRPPWRCTPFGPGQFGHASEQTPQRTPTQQHIAVGVHQPEMHAVPPRPRRFRRSCAAVHPRCQSRRPMQCAIQGHRTQAGAAGVHTVAPRSNSAWAKSDGCAVASGSAPSSAASRRSTRLGRRQRILARRTAAPPRAPRCHRPARSAGRTRSPPPPMPCTRRCPAEPAGRRDRAGNRPLRPPHVRRHAGCGRGRSSLALPRRRALRSSGAAASASTFRNRLKKAS